MRPLRVVISQAKACTTAVVAQASACEYHAKAWATDFVVQTLVCYYRLKPDLQCFTVLADFTDFILLFFYFTTKFNKIFCKIKRLPGNKIVCR